MKREHPEAVRRASVCINFEDNTEDIELKFDASQINGWSVNPSVQPCRVSTAALMHSLYYVYISSCVVVTLKILIKVMILSPLIVG